MKKNKFGLIILGIFCTLSGYAQEEFFGNKNGLTLSGSFNLDNSVQTEIKTGGLSLYLKNGIIFSGSYSKMYNTVYSQVSLNYLFNNSKHTEGMKSILGLSFGSIYDRYNINKNNFVGVNMGLIKVFFYKSNFPFSIGGSASFASYLYNMHYKSSNLGLTIGYTQSFFAKGWVYPVLGVSKSFIIGQDSSDWFVHAGLNIRLS